MSNLLLLVIFLLASLSLVSYVYCWMDIRSGRPHILSLRQITTVMDREKLNRMFGQPERGFYYQLTPQMLREIIVRRQIYFYRECAADGLCILGAWRFMTREAPSHLLWAFILLGLVCQGAYLAYSMILVKKWGHQIREEIDNSED